MVVEHGEVDKFLEQEENVTEQLTDPNQVKSVLIIIAQMRESKLIIRDQKFLKVMNYYMLISEHTQLSSFLNDEKLPKFCMAYVFIFWDELWHFLA